MSYSPIIRTVDNSGLSLSYIGGISTSSLSLSNVFLVPKLLLNLISIGQLCDIGLEVQISHHGCSV